MNASDIQKIVFEILAGIGGIGVVFTAIVGFSSNFIADKLQKKYQLKLNEELEKYKASLTSKIYISKTRFDAEFLIYQNLSFAFSECVKAFSILIPSGFVNVPADKEFREQQDKGHYSDARNAYVVAQDELSKSIPFIPKEFCDGYRDLLKLCSLQLYDFEERWNVSYLGTKEEKSVLGQDSYKRTGEINQKFDELNDIIRDYLTRLDVL